MAIDDLIEALQEDPNLEPSTETLLPFVDGPEFFERWLKADLTSSANLAVFKRRLHKKEGNLLNLLSEKKKTFIEYVQSKFDNLDDIRRVYGLGRALGVSEFAGDIARALVANEFISSDVPDGYTLCSRKGGYNRYFREDIVGEKQKKKNLRKTLYQQYKSLCGIPDSSALKRMLGLDRSNNQKDIVRKLLDLGIMDPELPKGHTISKSPVCWYVDGTIMTPEQKDANLAEFIRQTYNTIDDIKGTFQALATALGVPNHSDDIAREVLRRNILGDEIPEGHPITKGPGPSRFIDPAFVEPDKAESNLKKYVRNRYLCLEHLYRPNKGLATALKVPNSIPKLREKLAKLGWLKPGFTKCFDPNAYCYDYSYGYHENSSLLDQLVDRIIQHKKELHLELPDLNCQKGFLFESLVGVYLVNKFGRENVTPQKKMSVKYRDLNGRHHSIVFIDYLVKSKIIYEIKWQNFLDNILDSAIPQTYAIEQATGIKLGPNEVKVICRHKSPNIQTNFAEDISLEEEATKMSLPKMNRRITELFEYNSFEDLISGDQNEPLYLNALKEIDELIQEGDAELINNYTLAFTHIYMNGEDVTNKLSNLVDKIRARYKLDKQEITKLFGEKKILPGERQDYEERLEIIRRQVRRFGERFLVSVYNHKYQTPYKELTDDMIEDIGGWSLDEFEDVSQKIFDKKQRARQERLEKKRKTKVSLEDQILTEHEKAYQRKRHETIRELDRMYSAIESSFRELDPFVDASLRAQEISQKYNNEFGVIAELFRNHKLGNVSKAEYNLILIKYSEVHKRIYASLEDACSRMFEVLRQDLGSRDKSPQLAYDQIGQTIGKLREILIEAQDLFEQSTQELITSPLAEAICAANEKVERKEIWPSRRERDILWYRVTGFRMQDAKYVVESYKALIDATEKMSHLNRMEAALFISESMVRSAKGGKLVSSYPLGAAFGFVDFSLSSLKIFSDLSGYLLDNFCGMEGDSSIKQQYILKEVGEFLYVSPEIRPVLDCPIIEEMLAGVYGLIMNLDPEKIHQGLRKFDELILCFNRNICLESYEIAEQTIKQSGINVEDNRARKEGIKRHSLAVYDRFQDSGTLQKRMILDYYAKKAYNAKVLQHLDPQRAIEYLGGYYVSPHELSLGVNDFASCVTALKEQDEQFFKHCLIELGN